jgi:mono/diheme cytochrome c family protein
MTTRLLLLALFALNAACTQKTPGAASPLADNAKPAAADAQVGARLFRERCALCHGTVGAADSPMAKALQPKPRAFSDSVWQKEVSDEHLQRVIAMGGEAVGKSAVMPANTDLSAEQVSSLVLTIRSFAPAADQ